jgi:hypothetical protein
MSSPFSSASSRCPIIGLCRKSSTAIPISSLEA